MNDDEPNIPTNLPPPSDPDIDRIHRDMETLKENTKEILESIEARKGTAYATICWCLFSSTQEFLVIGNTTNDPYCNQLSRSGNVHLSRAIAYLNASKEFAGILDDLRILVERANTDWHSKGHMG